MKRTPLKRTAGPKRTTPIKAKRAAPRRTNRDGIQGCTFTFPSGRTCTQARAYVTVDERERYCKKHGLVVADAEARRFVYARDPVCVANRDHADKGVQWAHVWTRGMRYIRLDADNAVGLCSGCHFAYTKSFASWVKWVERNRPGLLIRMLHREMWHQHIRDHVDLGDVIRTYRRGEPWNQTDPPAGWIAERAEEV